MRYLVFGTFTEALFAERSIFMKGAAVAESVGYELSESGAIVGEKDGEPDFKGLTSGWDTPRRRADGKWVLLHPEAHPDAENDEWLSFVMSGIVAPAEEASTDWWR